MRDEQIPALGPRVVTPRPGTAPAAERPAHNRPGDRARWGVTFLQHRDDSSVTVSTQPDGIGGGVILLRLESPMLDTVHAVYLCPAEASRLAEGLSRAALLATRTAEPTPAEPATGESATGESATCGPTAGGTRSGGTQTGDDEPVGIRLVVAGEGTRADRLAGALGGLPPGMRLRDFAADTDVTLVFEPPTAAPTGRGPGRPSPAQSDASLASSSARSATQ